MKGSAAEQFLVQRGDWLTEPDAVALAQNENGQWEVVVRLDGWYRDEVDARRSAKSMAKQLTSAVNKARHALGLPPVKP